VRAAFRRDGECNVSTRDDGQESVRIENPLLSGTRSHQAKIDGRKNQRPLGEFSTN
jgi:hypothetical protein